MYSIHEKLQSLNRVFTYDARQCQGEVFCFFFWPCHVAYRILVPDQGMNPGPRQCKVRSPNHWVTWELLEKSFCIQITSSENVLNIISLYKNTYLEEPFIPKVCDM